MFATWPVDAAAGPQTRPVTASLPDIELPDGTPYLAPAPGGKRRIVNFWASWCVPCRRELPSLDRLAAHRRDIEVLAVSVDGNHDDASTAFIGRFPHLRLGFSSLAAARLYGALGIPYSVIFDPKGNEVARVARAIEWDGVEASALLRQATR